MITNTLTIMSMTGPTTQAVVNTACEIIGVLLMLNMQPLRTMHVGDTAWWIDLAATDAVVDIDRVKAEVAAVVGTEPLISFVKA